MSEFPDKMIVMYHSIHGEEIPAVIGSFPISFSRFKYQIRSAFELGYISRPLSYLSKKPVNGEKWLFVTADDATTDWTRQVLPWCESRKIYTHTAVITGTWYETPIYPLAHVLQVILSIRNKIVLEDLAKHVVRGLSAEQMQYINEIYAYEVCDERRWIKGACNLILEQDEAFKRIGKLTEEEAEILKQRFERPGFFAQFSYAEIGVHTTTHRALGGDAQEYLVNEIDACARDIHAAGLRQSEYFTLPMKPKFGGSLQQLEGPLKERGYKGLLYSESACWNGIDFVIPRIDAKNFEKALGIEALIEPDGVQPPSLIHFFLTQAKKHPDRTAVHLFPSCKNEHESPESLSYTELAEYTAKLCAELQKRGMSPGARCLVLLNNSIEFVLLCLAAAELNLVLAPMATSQSSLAIEAAIKSTDAKFLIAMPNRVSDIQRDCTNHHKEFIVIPFSSKENRSFFDNDLNVIFQPNYKSYYSLGSRNDNYQSDYILTLTSGSTGQPKPIVLKQKTKLHRIFEGAQDVYQLKDREVILAASPMYHSLAQRLVLLPLMIGGTSVILPGFTPQGWLDAVRIFRVTFTLAVSSHLEQLLKRMNSLDSTEFDLSSLRCLVSSSSLLPPEIKLKCIEKFSCDFHECYGTSEVGIVTNLSPADVALHRDLINTVGKPLPYVDIKIMDANKMEVPTGTIGEITCKTITAFSRYYNLPEATSESLVNGFFYTGDLGALDSRGFLYLHGRKKDLIIVAGTNVYPPDVELVLSEVDGVREAAVIGVKDSFFGEVVLAVLVVDGDVNKIVREAKRACMKGLADYQLPMAYEVVDSLPRNSLGKLMKHELRKQFEGYDATQFYKSIIL
jgi:long-chain acyl-CoA synthetase